ncbi:MAG TPA: heat-inducible transcriptional repressor HrcA [Candidatus Kapabacteria bacterium]|nr:heat-inducible transcriptional repressor HrcA [Candidatus Kapabacteria bacterium]
MLNQNFNKELNEREKEILQRIVHLYILNGNPVGSRYLSKIIQDEMKLSPATLRNIMSDLEELHFITHPHTSAGRVPTDRGYRFYVDNLVNYEKLNKIELETIRKNLLNIPQEFAYQNASKLLGALSQYLSIIELPSFKDYRVLKVELVNLSSNKVLVVLDLESDFLKTVTLEISFEISNKELSLITSIINEKIVGKPISYIRNNFSAIFSDSELKDTPIIRLFTDSVDKIFDEPQNNQRLMVTGARNLLNHPEFEDMNRIRTIIELVESEEIIIHVLDKLDDKKSGEDMNILIGSELNYDMLDDYSFIRSSFKIGSASGSIGIIGPKRMNYAKMISLVKIFSEVLSVK